MASAITTAQARTDMLDIWLYIARNSIEAADRWIERLESKCNKLADNPGLGRRRDELAPGILSFPVGSYVIFYRATPNAIEVVRVLHGARDIESVF